MSPTAAPGLSAFLPDLGSKARGWPPEGNLQMSAERRVSQEPAWRPQQCVVTRGLQRVRRAAREGLHRSPRPGSYQGYRHFRGNGRVQSTQGLVRAGVQRGSGSEAALLPPLSPFPSGLLWSFSQDLEDVAQLSLLSPPPPTGAPCTFLHKPSRDTKGRGLESAVRWPLLPIRSGSR